MAVLVVGRFAGTSFLRVDLYVGNPGPAVRWVINTRGTATRSMWRAKGWVR